ncbi:substrate-binding periplasmic protein [Desulfovibrio sp. TomC]|uniref:substrate-binding periplasmic protein n=1 Tax=Desulfovibrio sp. TomC TaxID=1562888 RepID=UPI0005755723|nr:transporter substrate-binding domain-containing protein [Desulfovibrio sp. TomC]KHK01214.1 putative ABC transporter, periplasmic substrate-binding protein [Desulfovibrio sp. TomC]
MSRRLLCAILASLAALAFQSWPGPVLAGESIHPVTVLVFHRPPYYLLNEGKAAGGFLLLAALEVFDRARIPVTVREMPPGRIVATVADGKSQVCAVGWIKTPEREAFARFSLPLYRNQPVAVAISRTLPMASAPPPNLADLLRTELHWGLREGFSYGKHFDKAFAEHPPRSVKRFSDTTHLVELVAQGRLDAMLVDPEELAWIISQKPELGAHIRLLQLADAPPGVERSIMCSTAVPPETIARLDGAVTEFLATDQYRDMTSLSLPH